MTQMNTDACIDLMVVPNSDGKLEVLHLAQLPAGRVVVNARMIRVSGSGLVVPPKGPQTAQQLQEWLARLESNGFQVAELAALLIG